MPTEPTGFFFFYWLLTLICARVRPGTRGSFVVSTLVATKMIAPFCVHSIRSTNEKSRDLLKEAIVSMLQGS